MDDSPVFGYEFYVWIQRHGDWVRGFVMFCFGLAAGSFLNVVICRLPHGVSLLWPSSSCPACGAAIRIRDNIPVLGWLFLGGRCRDCRAPIPWRYPAVELVVALLWGVVAWMAVGADALGGPWERSGLALAQLLFVSLLAAVACIDWDYQIIPDELSVGGAVAALALSAALPGWALECSPEFVRGFPALNPRIAGFLAALAGLLSGALVMGAITVAGTWLFKARLRELRKDDPELDTAVGLGDLKLMALVGAFLGWRGFAAALFIGVWYGSFAGVWIKWRTGWWPRDAEGRVKRWTGAACLARWRSGASVMAFGPFLALGALTAFFAHGPVTAFFTELINLAHKTAMR